MIKVNLLCERTGNLVGFEINGHANDELSGKDIICAAVSSAAYLVLNTVTEVIHADADVSIVDTGSMYLRVKDSYASVCRDVFSGFKVHMLCMEEQCPKNIIVNYLEV